MVPKDGLEWLGIGEIGFNGWRWWLLVVVGGCWWLLVVVGGCWWLLVVVGGCWWLLVVVGGWRWMMVVIEAALRLLEYFMVASPNDDNDTSTLVWLPAELQYPLHWSFFITS